MGWLTSWRCFCSPGHRTPGWKSSSQFSSVGWVTSYNWKLAFDLAGELSSCPINIYIYIDIRWGWPYKALIVLHFCRESRKCTALMMILTWSGPGRRHPWRQRAARARGAATIDWDALPKDNHRFWISSPSFENDDGPAYFWRFLWQGCI